MASEIISMRGLTKRYSRRGALALDHIDLSVEAGEVLGFLGPNGAGKTTTIRLLLDLIRPTEGAVSLLGADPRSGGPTLRRRLGYLPGELPFGGRQSAHELLSFLGNLRGGVNMTGVATLSERFDLDLSKPIRSLSKGNKQKVGIVQAFMHHPELLILDEPSSGLDPLLQRVFADLVRERRDAGATVFMSSHILSEVQDVADRIAILREGRLVATESVEAARARAPRHVQVVFASPVSLDEFESLDGLRDVSADGNVLTCVLVGDVDLLVKVMARHHVLSLMVEPPNIEDVFLDYYVAGGEDHVA